MMPTADYFSMSHAIFIAVFTLIRHIDYRYFTPPTTPFSCHICRACAYAPRPPSSRRRRRQPAPMPMMRAMPPRHARCRSVLAIRGGARRAIARTRARCGRCDACCAFRARTRSALRCAVSLRATRYASAPFSPLD